MNEEADRARASACAHPTRQALTAYGGLRRRAFEHAWIGRHVQACETCSAFVSTLEEAEGRRLLAEPPAAMRPDALQIALARLK